MKDASFREILQGFLEEKSEIPSENANSAAPPQPEEHKVFHTQGSDFPLGNDGSSWSIPKHFPKFGYQQKPASRQQQSPPAAPAPVPEKPKEIFVATSQLHPSDKADCLLMVKLGAVELNERISPLLLKRAYRRVVKTLHPDALKGLPAFEQERRTAAFRLLQSAYERLSDSLPEYFNDLACDSESASAPGSRRPNAA